MILKTKKRAVGKVSEIYVQMHLCLLEAGWWFNVTNIDYLGKLGPDLTPGRTQVLGIETWRRQTAAEDL